jgi:hypothetical protein
MVDNKITVKKSLLLKNHPPYSSATIEQRRRFLIDGRYKCAFCGFHHLKNIVDSFDNEYFIVDPFCYYFLHVSLLGDDDATVVYLPHLQRSDVSSLQRTIFIALQSSEQSDRDQAKNIHNWLLSHEKYIENKYKTTSFREWKKVISYMTDNISPDSLSGIHIIYKNFSIFNKYYNSLKLEYKNYPISKWVDLYKINNQ